MTTKPRDVVEAKDDATVASLSAAGPAAPRIEAARQAAKLRSVASLDALIQACSDRNTQLRRAAKASLVSRRDSPGLADHLHIALAAQAKRAPAALSVLPDPDEPEQRSAYEQVLQQGDDATLLLRAAVTVGLVSTVELPHLPLVELLRTIARTHRHHDLRSLTRSRLVELRDEVTHNELATLFGGPPIADIKLAQDVLRAVYDVDERNWPGRNRPSPIAAFTQAQPVSQHRYLERAIAIHAAFRYAHRNIDGG